MKKDSRKVRLVVGLLALGALVALLVLRPTTSSIEDGNGKADAVANLDGGHGEGAKDPGSRSPRVPRRPGVDPATMDARAVNYLRDQFGATISNKHSQIKALEKLINYLRKTYPDDWEQRLVSFLALAFPGMEDELFAQYQNMSAYNDWLNSSRGELAGMSPAEKRQAMKDARFRFFGQDAAEIWEEALRHEQIYDAMDGIEQTPEANVNEKLDTYLDAIHESYGDKATNFIENRQTELLTNFLTLPSVQGDLRTLTATQRQKQLTEIRRGMGMDDEALDRWRALDEQRDEAWETGERYMQARRELEESLQGDELEAQLEALRRSTFGEDATTIGNEEATGFFRFGHPRVYGKE